MRVKTLYEANEQVSLAVTIYTCRWEMFGSNISRHTDYHD
jgi:hypothetical protein